MPKARALRSAPALLVLFCVVLGLISPWTIAIPQAGFGQGFGFQNVFCWLAVVCALGAILFAERGAGIALALVGEASLLAWFGWVMWVVTSPAFARFHWPFVGIDLLGSGWYLGALAILIAGGVVAQRLYEREVVGLEVWLAAALPGYGLICLGRPGRGLIWTTLFGAAVLLASYSSPEMSIFEQFRNFGSLPPAPPSRAPTWTLLGIACVGAALSVADTVRIALSDRTVPRARSRPVHP